MVPLGSNGLKYLYLLRRDHIIQIISKKTLCGDLLSEEKISALVNLHTRIFDKADEGPYAEFN